MKNEGGVWLVTPTATMPCISIVYLYAILEKDMNGKLLFPPENRWETLGDVL
jgi:hypothetical protein